MTRDFAKTSTDHRSRQGSALHSDANGKNDPRIVVAVLYGGRSPEHSVSCVSAGAVMANIDSDRFRVIPIGITRTGQWKHGASDPSMLAIVDRLMPEVDPRAPGVRLAIDTDNYGIVFGEDGEAIDRADVVLPVLHGPFGEDGTIQGLLELSGIAYVGPGVLASAAGMDKDYTKRLFAEAGLPVGQQIVVDKDCSELKSGVREQLGLPVFVKPARGGSSIGVSKVTDWAEFPRAVQVAGAHDRKIVVESEIVGKEIECGVLEFPDGSVRASVLSEIHMPGDLAADADSASSDSDDGFYDFDTKYLDNTCTFDVPARIDDDVADQIKAMAVRAFEVLGAKGLSRVDFFLTSSGPVINEVNTFPGCTPISMFPQMWAATGVDYRKLLSILLDTELGRLH